MSELTEKQRIFCEEYVKDFNGSRAAREAGYSRETANVIASENLTKPYIKEKINELIKDRNERLRVDRDKVVAELAKIGLAKDSKDMGGFYIELKDKIKALELLGRHTGAFNEDESNKGVINVTIGKPSE